MAALADEAGNGTDENLILITPAHAEGIVDDDRDAGACDEGRRFLLLPTRHVSPRRVGRRGVDEDLLSR